MEAKINSRLLLIGILSMILTMLLSAFAFHAAFSKQSKKDIQVTANILSQSYRYIDKLEDFESFAGDGLRITAVGTNGEILFDSEVDGKLENHMTRPEIISAMQNGTGEDIRTSTTMGYNTYYYAVKLDDGNILRVATEVENLYSIYDSALPAIAAIGILILVLSVVLSMVLTKQLVNPILAMAENLDEIDKNVPYKELKPFAFAIKEQQTKKQENEKMRQEFTANVSHELKTPLTSISGYAEMIETGMAHQEDVKGFAEKIHNEASRLITLIGDIIKLSELDEPASGQPVEMVDLYELARDTAELLYFNAERRDIRISVTGGRGLVWGNKGMLSELVYNLCDNAIRYNHDGGTVEINIQKDDRDVLLSVKDSGIGIPKEHQSRVFERFYRVDKSRSKETGGTGLGLAIVKHVAIQHGASIVLFSEEGKGTQITVKFPRDGLAAQNEKNKK